MASGRLRLFTLYVDFPAAVRARWASNAISKYAGESWITSTEMWKVDSLAASNAISKMVAQEAARADIVVVVASSLNYRHHEAVQWLETLAACVTDRQDTGLLIGLFGDDDNHTSELGWTVKTFLNSASRMNRDFIWHWMEAGAMNDCAWLTDNLDSFLERKCVEAEKSLSSGLALIAA